MTTRHRALRICPLCEAGCGLELTITDERVTRVRGNQADVFSHGFLCPKGSLLHQLDEDPDVLRTPMVRRDGELRPDSWDNAFAVAGELLSGVINDHGRDAVALYLGNPNAHNLSGQLYNSYLIRSVGSRKFFTAGTVDQISKQIAVSYMYGDFVVPVPDLDHCAYLLVLGADPLVSNGSMCTAPDMPGRLEALRARGGKVTVVDPRRSRTAEVCDEWIPIVPGRDAFFLIGLIKTLFDEGLAEPGDHLAPFVRGIEDLRAFVTRFRMTDLGDACGVPPGTMVRIAREISGSQAGAVYGRIGVCTQEFGTVCGWLIEAINILTGNLDRRGGSMFARCATESPKRGTPRQFVTGRWKTRVRGLPEVAGELPIAALAEEIETPGAGQIRGLITVAGNPVLSTPRGDRLGQALRLLDCMISVDRYVNETTKHAHVVFPAPPVLCRSHYDLSLSSFAIRNVAKYSAPTFPMPPGAVEEWEVLVRLGMAAQGRSGDPLAEDDVLLRARLERLVTDERSPVHGRAVDELFVQLSQDGTTGPERLLDLMLRCGPYGDHFGVKEGLSLARLRAQPNGIDLGPLHERVPEILRTPSGCIELAPAPLLEEAGRLLDACHAPAEGEFRLVGRRQLRSNNSWMHNIPRLMTGRRHACTALLNSTDAEALGLIAGDLARIESRVGAVVAVVEPTDHVARGVVSLPHGWGHAQEGDTMRVAASHPGVNSNILSDDEALDPISMSSVLNGIPVAVTPACR